MLYRINWVHIKIDPYVLRIVQIISCLIDVRLCWNSMCQQQHVNAGWLRELPVTVYVRRQWVRWSSFLSATEWWMPAVLVHHGRPGLLSGKRM